MALGHDDSTINIVVVVIIIILWGNMVYCVSGKSTKKFIPVVCLKAVAFHSVSRHLMQNIMQNVFLVFIVFATGKYSSKLPQHRFQQPKRS